MKTRQEIDKEQNQKKPTLSFRLLAADVDRLQYFMLPGETPSAAARRIVMEAIAK
jgi:hypothetical protein